MQTWAGALLVLGSTLFLIAAFSPISGRVFRPGITPEDQIEAVRESRAAWVISSAFFGAGSAVAVIGLFLFAGYVAGPGNGAGSAVVSYLAAGLASIGAVFWLIVVYYRMVHTPEQIFLEGTLDGGWLFPTYTVLTQLALLATGYVLWQADYPGWLGLGMIAVVSLTIIALIIFRDMPPFVHYLWMLIMGIMLIRSP